MLLLLKAFLCIMLHSLFVSAFFLFFCIITVRVVASGVKYSTNKSNQGKIDTIGKSLKDTKPSFKTFKETNLNFRDLNKPLKIRSLTSNSRNNWELSKKKERWLKPLDFLKCTKKDKIKLFKILASNSHNLKVSSILQSTLTLSHKHQFKLLNPHNRTWASLSNELNKSSRGSDSKTRKILGEPS